MVQILDTLPQRVIIQLDQKIILYHSSKNSLCHISYVGPTIWNGIPLHIRQASTLSQFKCSYERELLSNYAILYTVRSFFFFHSNLGRGYYACVFQRFLV